MKTNSKTTDQQQQLRKIAILIATLDEPLSERLLADLPPREAAAVQRIVNQLEDVDPAEYRAVVADFRQGIVDPSRHPSGPLGGQLDGVELDESLLARMAAPETYHASVTIENDTGSWHTLSDIDAAPLVEMLSLEQPQTIAVVLSRLETDRAANLIGKLPPALQAEVLLRLADLDPADERTLEVVESQLAAWIDQQRQRRKRLTAGRDLVQRILQSTPTSQRAALLTQLGERNPALVESLATPPHEPLPRERQPYVAQSPENESQVAPSDATVDASHVGSGMPTIRTVPTIESSDPLSELEALDDQSLLRALRLAERQTVMLALVGASAGLMKRIVQGLPRRRANQFRQQIRAIGPTRLSDMLAAQRELVRCAQPRAAERLKQAIQPTVSYGNDH